MAGVRISRRAREDLEHILEVSLERWGDGGQARYRELLEAALHAIASEPEGPLTRDRGLLGDRLRSFHLRHARHAPGVQDPVHVIYYRWTRSALVEVVRILHERMDPAAQLDAATQRETPDKKRRL
ncbi:MAG: type II toxin-antitoxin system RelE/ParE family toxin [Gemmatimonadaceae bacterium]